MNNDPGQYAFLTQSQKDALNTTPQNPVAPAAPIAQSPVIPPMANPNPQQPMNMPTQTPPAPQVTINNNTQSTQPKPVPTSTPTPTSTPFNGSVVDLLNSQGMASDFGSRSKDAAGFGMQGYKGTAAQNAELAKKYQELFASKQGTPPPESGGAARTAVSEALKEQGAEKKVSADEYQQQFFDDYGKMNPAVKMLYDQIAQINSSASKRTSMVDELKKLYSDENLPVGTPGDSIGEAQMKLLNFKNIMEGTEQDIRDEISKVGGFATESQVQALKGARNKTLLKEATNIQDSIALKQDYIDQVVKMTGADRDAVEKDLDRKLGLTEKLASLTESMNNAAKENYQDVIKTSGYTGLSSALNEEGKRNAENILGLSKGTLSSATKIASLDASKLENKPLQFVSGTENQQSGVFNPNTGTFTARAGGGGGNSNTTGGASGSVTRDAESVMSGVLNLQDISVKDNYRAQVASELRKEASAAIARGDIYGVMAASAAFDKEPGDTFLQSMEKVLTTLNQIGVLQENIAGTNTGPIVGLFRGANPWDTNAQTIKAQLQAIVPNLARGVYGEVGVLTDNDIKNYAKTIPNIKSTEDVRNAILYITVDMIKKNVDAKIQNQAAGQRDMSGYADTYKGLTDTADNILASLPGSSKPGSQNTTRMSGPGGIFEVPNNQVDNFKQNGYKQI